MGNCASNDTTTSSGAVQPVTSKVRRVLVLRNAVTGAASFSNQGVDKAVAAVKSAFPNVTILERDLVKNQVPFLNEENCEAIRNHTLETPAQRAADRLATELIDELKSVDLVIIGLPRYNFGVPTSFKTYLDFVARPRVTFRYTSEGPEGLLPNIPVWCVMSAGGVYGEDQYTQWLTAVLGFVGLKRLHFLSLEGTAMSSKDDLFAAFDATLNKNVKALKQ